MKILFDTSAILNGAYLDYNINDNKFYISDIVLRELENIKTAVNKDDSLKYDARKVVHFLKEHEDKIHYITFTDKKFKHNLKRFHLNDYADARILISVLLLNENDIYFCTSDLNQFLLAKQLSIPTIFYEKKDNKELNYCGWRDYHPTDLQFVELYTHLDHNIFNCKTNEYIKLWSDDELKDILFWDGERYQKVTYKNFTSPLGEQIKPRNTEQKMLFNLLQNTKIKIKLCLGGFGDGKTFCMLQHAIKGVNEGRFSKIVFVRNNIEVRGSKPIGFLGGSLIEKIRPFIEPIADLTSPDYLDQMIEEGILEPVPLGFCRGRDWSNNTLILVDEAENLTTQNIQLLLGRVGEGSEIWFAGDLKQIDAHLFEDNNGIRKMANKLAGEPLFGMVRLIKSERSATAELSNKLDN